MTTGYLNFSRWAEQAKRFSSRNWSLKVYISLLIYQDFTVQYIYLTMSEARRRLSSGSGMLKMCDDENSDDDDLSIGFQEKSIYTFPKKSNSRRRSSFGGQNSSKSPVNAVEQARIADMYKTVIQMSSENVS